MPLEGAPGSGQADAVRRGGDTEDLAGLGRGEVLPDREGEDLLLRRRQALPGVGHLETLTDGIGVLAAIDSGSGHQPDRHCTLAVLAARHVEKAVPGNRVEPGQRLAYAVRYVVEPTPRDEERLGDDVVRARGIGAPPREVEDMVVVGGVQGAEALF